MTSKSSGFGLGATQDDPSQRHGDEQNEIGNETFHLAAAGLIAAGEAGEVEGELEDQPDATR